MSGVGEFSGTYAAGPYRLVRALDADGQVYEARHGRLTGRFAVKLFGAVDARAFQRGAQQASALRHPSIVRVVDFGLPPSGAFVAMEWVDGRSLAVLLAEGGPFPPSAVARVVDGVALGLQAAHRQGVAHGRLSPSCILVSARGSANDDEAPGAEHTKILGFGLGPARAHAGGVTAAEATPYTPPEALEELDDASRPRGDQYALAAIAYELLAGEPPTGDAVADRPPRSLREYDPTISVDVDDVVQRALSFEPDARWADVHTFAARLREAVFADTFAEDALEERTRLAPLPLTVTKPPLATPTPIELPPVIASVDVDLGTPAPSRRLVPHELPHTQPPVEGVIAMNPPPARQQPFSMSSQMPGQFPSAYPTPRSAPHHGIQPTPTFSFSDELELGPPSRRRRRRSGGGFGLLVLVVAAGVGGYLSVEKRVWQQAEPLLARVKELGRSLQTLAPGASPEPPAPVATAPVTGAAPSTAAPAAAASAPAVPASAQVAAVPAAPPTIQPEVVPIEPTTPAKTGSSAHHASRAHHARERAERPARAELPTPAQADRSARARAAKALSDEAATEEALLAPP